MSRYHSPRVCLLVLAFPWLAISHALAQANHDKTIRMTAVIQDSPAQIQLNWLAPSSGSYTITHQKIWRRQPGAAWGGEYATLLPGDLTYTDTAVEKGVRYEYRIVRLFANGPLSSTGFLETGIRIPEVDRRGSLILLVRDTAAAGLATELTQLQQDLAGDGWHIIREDIGSAQTVTDVKAVITGHYNNPATPDVAAVFVFGRVPVPYSGNIVPDGHTNNHQGAWPADVFYAEMDGVWTDSTVNHTTAPARTQNIPGDGKYDQSILPSPAELQIGRVDFNGMTVFPDAGTTEIDLLRRYLQRNHDYRHLLGNYTNIPRRGLVDSNFGYFGGEAFASNAWWNFTSFFGAGNITSADWFGTLASNSYLWAFGDGGGTYTSASGVGTSAQFGSTDSKAVFCMLFGSYFGDWDNTNNFLRAPLANTTDGLALASMWAGRPHWHIHSMATGRTLGYGARLTQNNLGDYPTGAGGGMVHAALMGDPTLRLFPVLPVSALGSSTSPGEVSLSWTASPDTNIQGYAIYRGLAGADTTGSFTRLNPSLVTGTSYNDLSGVPNTAYTYMVRAVKLETSSSASYLNSSQGVFHDATPGAVTGPEISISGNGQPVQSGTSASLEANHTYFGSGEINLFTQSRTFTISNDGTTDLTLSGAPIVTLTGTHAADFSVTLQPATNPISAGNQTTFSINFAPTGLGARDATVHISSDDPDEASYAFAISGTGIPNTPDISVPVTSFTKTLAAGTSDTATMAITNNGLGNLDYTLTSKYTHRDSNHASGPVYQWNDISSVGTEITTWSGTSYPTDNGGSASIPIGFSFPFFATSHSSVIVSTEGFITFGSWADAPSNVPDLPSLGAPASMIAVYWDDLDLRSSFAEADQGRVYYLQTDPDTFIIQYEGVYQYSASPSTGDERLSCQIILKSSGEIQLHYKTVPTTEHYTVGMQNSALSEGLTVSANTTYLANAMAVRILPPAATTGNWLTASPAMGTTTPSNTTNTTLTFDPATLPFGSYFGCLTVSSNDPDTPDINVDLDMEGGILTPEITLTGNNLTIAYNSAASHSSNHTDFGERSISDPDLVRSYTIHNAGSATLTLGTVSVSGTDFTITQPATSSLAPGASTTFQVTFPAAAPPGTHHATVTVPSNDSNESSYTFAVSAIKLGPLASWRKTHFGSSADSGNGANNADPDADGMKNLVEYALGGNPNINDSTAIRPVHSEDANGRLSIQFNRYPLKTDINYIVQATNDLSAWPEIAISTAGAATTNTAAFSVVESGSSPVQVIVTDSEIPTTRRFLRLKIVEN
ncbi:MAG: choice-of-anchor D domain-containing protein [Akkermansiaceae bacterium]|nr:choice-of-anchor D domain-containing protein [Akkermansiaceae bacterium]